MIWRKSIILEAKKDEDDDVESTDYTDLDDDSSDDDEISTPEEDTSSDEPEESDTDTSEEEDGTTEEEPADDEPSDDDTESTDYTVDSDTETPTDDESSDDESSEEDTSEEEPELTDDEKEQNRKLFNDFDALYNSCQSIISRLSSLNRSNLLINQTIAQILSNINIIEQQIYEYLIFSFTKKKYPMNLYNYNKFITALQLNVEMLKKINVFAPDSQNN